MFSKCSKLVKGLICFSPFSLYRLVLYFAPACSVTRGATMFSKLGVQFLGLSYYTEQNTDGIPSFVHYCNLQQREKLWWSVQIWGVRIPQPPVVAPLSVIVRVDVVNCIRCLCMLNNKAIKAAPAELSANDHNAIREQSKTKACRGSNNYACTITISLAIHGYKDL